MIYLFIAIILIGFTGGAYEHLNPLRPHGRRFLFH